MQADAASSRVAVLKDLNEGCRHIAGLAYVHAFRALATQYVSARAGYKAFERMLRVASTAGAWVDVSAEYSKTKCDLRKKTQTT